MHPSSSRRRRGVVSRIALIVTLVGATMPGIFGPVFPSSTAEAAVPGARQVYYLPLTTDDHLQALFSIGNPAAVTAGWGTSNQYYCCLGPMQTVVSIVSGTANNTIAIDHWEDGYDADAIGSPGSSTEQFVRGSGGVLNFEQSIPTPRTPSATERGGAHYFVDGRDKIIATGLAAVTIGGFPTQPGPFHAGGVAAYSYEKMGYDFASPIGENADFNLLFNYVGMMLVAGEASTVDIDWDADGTVDTRQTLAEGESYFVDGGVNLGARVASTGRIGAYLVTGDQTATYEARFLELFPSELWSSSYLSPVGSKGTSGQSQIYLYNATSAPITIDWVTGGGLTGTISNLGANSQHRFVVPGPNGVFFQSQGAEPFYAVQLFGADTSSQSYDWGFTLIPGEALTPVSVVPYGPGSEDVYTTYTCVIDPNSGAAGSGGPDGIPDCNYSAVWIATLADTRIYIDLDADPTTGAKTDPDGNKYDFHCDILAYESRLIYGDGNLTDNTACKPIADVTVPATQPALGSGPRTLTGARIYTNSGVRLATAWGQAPLYAGRPALDWGTAVFPFPSVDMNKIALHTGDIDGDGKVDPGDEITYEIYGTNNGLVPVDGIVVLDEVPDNTVYTAGSTLVSFFDGSGALVTGPTPVADDGAGATDSPIDGPGLTLGSSLPLEQSFLVEFKVTVDDPLAAGVKLIVNDVTMTSPQGDFFDRTITKLDVPRLQVQKTSDVGATPARSGDTITYTVAVANNDNFPHTAVALVDTPPAGLTYVAGSTYKDGVPIADDLSPATPFPLDEGGESAGTLAVDEVVYYTFQATVDQPMAAAVSQLTNLATVTSDQDPVGSSDSVTDPVDRRVDLTIAKVDLADPVLAGTTISYEVEVTNNGPDQAGSVEVADTLPAGLTFDGASSSPACSASGQTVTCTAATLDPGVGNAITFTIVADVAGTAAGTVSNTATVTFDGTDSSPGDETDGEDTFVQHPEIVVEKNTNSQDADAAPGPYVVLGGAVTWTYVVTNPGNVALSGITVVDDQGVTPVYQSGDTDLDGELDTTETWTYTASGSATSGQYTNTATATGTPPLGPDVTDTDDSHYFGSDAGIVVENATNGQDADTGTGPYVAVGGAVTWTYVVTNPGNVALSGITVVDDQGVTPVYQSGDTDLDSLLDTTETWTYTASGTATAGQYANIATATGTPPVGPDVADTDPSHHFGSDAEIVIENATNGQDADTPTGPYIAVGDTATWTYVVTNPGNVALSGITVVDDQGVTPVYQSGDTDLDSLLDTDETWTYSAAGTATAGQYANIATATGTPPVGGDVSDTDPSHHFGTDAGIVVENATNGQDADTPTGPYIAVGDTATWTYIVTNPGNVALSGITVTDDQGVTVTYVSGDTDLDSLLDTDETWTYTATGTATAGQYTNTATATGTPPVGGDVADTDPSNHFGSDPQIVIENATNGDDADTPTGPYIPVGDTATWTYVVTNPGNVALASISVVDDQGVTVTYVSGDTDLDGELDTTETWTYTAAGTATAGQYTNTATATGTPPVGADATDTDPSHHYGSDAAIVVEKTTNGQDADAAPGPYVPVGNAITWTYTITNPGNVALSSISVVDDQGVTVNFVGGDTNTNNLLDPGETWSYDGFGFATAGQYTNTATATGTPPIGPDAADTDDSHYFGTDPRIVVENATNGDDADTPTGPFIAVGDTATWTYVITNPGNVALSSISVVDDQGVTVTYVSGDTDLDGELDTTETWTYTASGTATAGQYTNIATATGTPPAGPDVADTDPSHHYGSDAQIVIENATNGQDADTPTGPYIAVGDTATWTYVVTNPGNVALSGITVVDDQGVTPVYQSGDTDLDAELDTTETWTYTASGTATAGQYTNIATATGTPPVGADVADTDPSHHFGSDPQIVIENATNGQDADTPTGPYIAVGDTATWTYVVTNPGNVALSGITVLDDQGVTVTYVSGDTDLDGELDTTETWTYTASGTATAGQYTNTATATGTPPVGGDVTDTDPSHHFGSDPQIVVENATNGDDADTAPGPGVPIGNAVTWTYVVTNPGNVALSGITVVDDQGVTPVYQSGDTDLDGELDTTETWAYTAAGTAIAGQYANIATATGTPPVGGDVTDTDPSHYFGTDAEIVIENATNGDDADTPTGPYVPVGSAVTWTYVVTNPGNVALSGITVVDDQGATPVYQSGDTDLDDELDTTETWTYTASGTATAGQYANTATATGTPPAGPDVTDTDPSHHFGSDPQIVVENATNGQDADTPTGPYIAVGDTATWTYIVTNPGNVALSGITVTDDQGAIPVYQSGDTDLDGELDTTETWTYTASGTAIAGQYANTATATGTPPVGPDVTDTDPSHHYGADAQIVVENATNGQDADTPTGPYIAVGDTATWTYIVTNPGNVALSGITVVDDQAVTVTYVSGDTDGDSLLDTTETWTYTASGTATAGQYTNIATATGTPPVGGDVTDTDPSNHFGSDPQIVIENATNGDDADTPTGPYVAVGDTATWTYVVTNPGNVALSGITVVDDQGVTVTYVSGDTDLDDELDTTETWTYTAAGTATAGQYTNLATATGTPPGGLPDATDTDPSHHFGSDPQIVVENATNGDDADTPTGPYVPVGSAVTWTYVVTNPGNVALSGITVVDDQGMTPVYQSGDTDLDDELDTTETWTYTAAGTATAGQYTNTATATGTPPVGSDVADTDPSHHFGTDAEIVIQNATNGQDADTPTGPYIAVGDTATWTYVVTNPGNVALSGITVVDDQGVTVTYVSGDTDLDSLLDTDETWTYTAAGTATAGQYTNLATATGTPPGGLPDATDTDPSHHFGSDPQIVVENATNGDDADTPTGPYVPVGDAVTWTYVVTNPGNVALSGITVVDDQGMTPVYQSGDTDLDGELDTTETWTYTAAGTATAGQYTNTATATGTPPVGADVADTDPSHHFGSDPQIVIENATNGQDADTPTGPFVVVGGAVAWTYVVTNPGNVALSGITVVDDQGVTPVYQSGDTDLDGELDTDETWAYTASGTATAGQYANIATATGTPPGGLPDATDTDPSNHFGTDPQIVIENATNGQDADTPTGPYIAVGDTATWTYVVTNPGNVALSGITVVDDQGATPVYQSGDTDLDSLLDTDETWTYTATGTATAGQYTNTATATGTPPGGLPNATDTDPSHHFGSDAGIVIEKSTNGQNADTIPGPGIATGATVTWTYIVTNPGNVPLSSIAIDDSDPGVVPAYVGGDDGNGLLDPGESWTYQATGTAVAGQYTNTATATGTPPGGLPDVSDTDDSHYFGADAGVEITKRTNGDDAATDPGPYVLVGDPVTWTFEVVNTGNVPLSLLIVLDDNGTPLDPADDYNPAFVGGDTNLDGLLDVTETWMYSTSGVAVAGQFQNQVTATAQPPVGPEVSDGDISHYFGTEALIVVEKTTNGQDADTAPGPYVPVGDPVAWTYTLTNPGNVALSAIGVADDQGVTPLYQSGDTDTDTLLDPGETWIYSAAGTATAGQYVNTATATGTPPGGLPDIADTDQSHYFGATAAITVEKSTNGQDADTAPGPYVLAGSTVTWTYTVTNPGNVAFSGVSVVDDQGVVVTFVGGDADLDTQLDPGETWSYEGLGVAIAGQYANTATVTGTPPVGGDVTDTDDSHYFGVDARIIVENATNGDDADTPTGPYVPVGDPVTWTYVVTNPGTVPLSGITVVDDQGVTLTFVGGDTNGDTLLDPTETWTYTASGTAVAGQYANTVTATGTPPVGPDPSDTDPSHYFGVAPAIVVENATNGDDADTPTGPYVPPGDPVTWTYTVTNPGNVALTGIAVVDDQGVTPVYQSGDTDLDGELDPGETWTYTASGTATPGQYTNTATATGTPPVGGAVTDTDPSHHYGVTGSIGDRVWNDLDGDGIQDAAEPGISAVTVRLVEAGPDGVFGTGDDVAQPDTLTGLDGAYVFANLRPGTFRASLTTPPAGYALTTPSPITISLGVDEDRTDADFGMRAASSIGDRVWNDLDGDGIQDAGEPGLAGVTVRLHTATDPVTPLATTTTGPNGAYRFDGLNPALGHLIVVALPAGALGFTPAATGSDPAADSDVDPQGRTSTITLTPGQIDLTRDAGIVFAGSIGDRVWFDLNGNGVQDPNEPGIGGVTVRLLDAGGATIATTTTANPTYPADPAAGTYRFDGLTPRAYTITIDPSTLPSGLTTATFDRDGVADHSTMVLLAGGSTVTDADFGSTGIGTIGDTAWLDTNGDGTQDPAEPGIDGVTLTVIWAGRDGTIGTNDDHQFPDQVTANGGTYLFSRLPMGTFRIAVGAADGYATTGPSVYDVQLNLADDAANSVLYADFPFQILGAQTLPRTGFDADNLALLALLLMLGGAAALLITRRRESDHHR